MCGYANSNAHIKILFQQTKYINCANSYMQNFWWEMIRMFTFPVLLLQYLGLCNILFMRNKRMIKKIIARAPFCDLVFVKCCIVFLKVYIKDAEKLYLK